MNWTITLSESDLSLADVEASRRDNHNARAGYANQRGAALSSREKNAYNGREAVRAEVAGARLLGLPWTGQGQGGLGKPDVDNRFEIKWNNLWLKNRGGWTGIHILVTGSNPYTAVGWYDVESGDFDQGRWPAPDWATFKAPWIPPESLNSMDSLLAEAASSDAAVFQTDEGGSQPTPRLQSPLETAAHSYLAAGLSVIALTGKAPNAMFHPEGLNTPLCGIPEDDADDALIHRLFDHPTTSGIGIPIPPHMVVIDIDGEEGAKQYFELCGGVIGDHPRATTGRGIHIWFATVKVHRSTVLGPKFDVKGVGGYVVAPPSRHPDGGIYRWVEPLISEESGQRVNVDFLPDAIEELLGEADLVAGYEPAWTIENGQIMRKKLDMGELKARIIEASDGDQNNQIARAALIARDEGVPFEIAMKELLLAAEIGGHPRRRAEIAIKSAYKRRRRA